MSKAKNVENVVEKSIDFMSQRFVAMVVSIVLLLGSVISLGINGLQFGLDFTGGLQIEPQYSEAVDLEDARLKLSEIGLKEATVVYFGSERDLKIATQQNREELIQAQLSYLTDGLSADSIDVSRLAANVDSRLPNGGLKLDLVVQESVIPVLDGVLQSLELSDYELTSWDSGELSVFSDDDLQVFTEKLLRESLSAISSSSVIIKRTEFVGPQVGGELRDQGGIGMLFALAVVMVYVALRFQFKFSVAAVAALAHDVIIVLGFFSFFKLDFDLTVLAAVLAVIGYSLNDTIVVSDRIRENFRKIRKKEAVEVVNISLTQTLGRTLVTSLTTMLVLLALFFVGGELIHAFSIALMIGVFIGTYSSIYVAANILLFMNITKEDLMEPVKEGVEQDEMP